MALTTPSVRLLEDGFVAKAENGWRVETPHPNGSEVCRKCGVRSDDPMIACLCVPEGETWHVDPTLKSDGITLKFPRNRIKIETKKYPDNNPKTTSGLKKLPLELVPPSNVAALAEAFADGAKKYGPYNWREKSVSSSIYYGACLRHLQAWWDGEDFAEDSGLHHLYHALACIGILVDSKSIGKLNDNRPPKGAAAQMQRDWINANHS